MSWLSSSDKKEMIHCSDDNALRNRLQVNGRNTNKTSSMANKFCNIRRQLLMNLMQFELVRKLSFKITGT